MNSSIRSTCLLFETIKIQDRQPRNLEYHNRRMNESRRTLFGCADGIRLEEFVLVPAELDSDLFKCRVIYNESIVQVQFEKYLPRIIKTLQLVQADSIQYHHKFLDRACLDQLMKTTQADDVLLVKNGLLTDTSIANIVFFDGDRWVTPATPLLCGTKRENYLECKRIVEEKLTVADLPRFQKAVLINAMLDLETGPIIKREDILPFQ